MSWIIIVLVGLVIAVYVKKTFSFENFQDMGIKRYREGDFYEAIKYLKKAIKKKPNHPETICALGESYLQNSIKVEPISQLVSKLHQKEAVLNFEKYLNLEPNGYHRPQIIQKIKSIYNNTSDKEIKVEIEKIFLKLNENLNQ